MTRDREEAARRAAEAFEVLGNEIRTGVVLALVDEAPLSFSELRERVGVADSGRFNYHLGKLTGRFVDKDEDGYRLRYHGHRVAHAVLAGSFTATTSFDPVPVEGDCIWCGEPALRGSYEDEQVRIACGACGERIISVAFPPTAVVERTPEAALCAFERWSRRQAQLDRDGICPECASPSRVELDDDPPESLWLSPVVHHRCDVCERTQYTAIGGAVLDHPAVLAFHDEDPRTGPYWANPYLLTNRHVEVRSREPWRVDVTFERDGERLVVTVDGDLSVVETATGR